MEFVTNSPEETEELGERLGRALSPGDVVAFTGDLGAGKTAFTRGIARGLGIGDRVTSPTFAIVNEYEGGRLPLFHFDMYRLTSSDELFDIGWEDYLARGGVCAVEWSENVADALERDTVRVDIRRGGEDEQAGDLGGACPRRILSREGRSTMKILALETSAAACSAALCQDGTLLAQSWQNSGLTHSRTLLPLVDSMLKNCGASLKEVEVIAVAAGPGSFTGLRIGVATAKGLAWPEDKPCAPCSTLESMAWPLAHLEGRVIVCAMDARRSQVYNALFLAAGEGLQRLTPDRAIGLDQLGEELKKVEKEKIVVGDGARLCYNTLTEQGITLKMAPEHLRMQSAWGVARAALELVRSGGLVSGEELAPVYRRLSQAERERLEREAKSK